MSEQSMARPGQWAVTVEVESSAMLLEQSRERFVEVQSDPELLLLIAGEQGPPGPAGSDLSEWQMNEW